MKPLPAPPAAAQQESGRPEKELKVPAWVELTMGGVVLASALIIWVIAPLYFRSREGHVDYIAAAVPFFVLLIFLELGLLYTAKIATTAGSYRFADTWSSVAAGGAQRMWVVMIFKILLPRLGASIAYQHVYDNYALYRVSIDSYWGWLGLALLVDFAYYWSHRLGHQLAFLWAGHSIHHASEHYNLSTALRQSIWQHVYETLNFIPAALFFPATLHMAFQNWNTIYQFWVHTCCIRRLGPLEWLMMTPSHHRVHHDRRVHKNYGGLLIVWDRMFGTFLDEEQQRVQSLAARKAQGSPNDDLEVCAFGTMLVPDTWSDCVVQTHVWRVMAAHAWQSFRRGDVRGVVRAFVVGPGFTTTTMPRTLAHVDKSSRLRFHCLPMPLLRAYIGAHFAAVFLAVFFIMATPHPPLILLAYCPCIILTLAVQGLLLDGRRAAPLWEAMRCLVFAVAFARAHSLPLLDNIPWAVACVLAAMHAASAVLCLRMPVALGSFAGRGKLE